VGNGPRGADWNLYDWWVDRCGEDSGRIEM
jgi:hypothetical protein